MRRKSVSQPPSARERLQALALAAGCRLGSIGDIEQLAGIDVRNQAQRFALWWRFRDLFDGPQEALFAAVMEDCAAVALRRLEAGELSLLPT